MSNYFTDVDEDTKKLIEECMEGLVAITRGDYLLNCLIKKCVQDKTVKEIFEAELKAKKEFEKELASRNKK